MRSSPESPKKKLMGRLLSGMSPGKRRVSGSQFSVIDQPSTIFDSDGSSSCVSRRSSLHSNITSASEYRAAFNAPQEMVRPSDPEELDRMFARVLRESNLGANDRMLSLGPDEKWRIIQAHARLEQQNDTPMAIIDRMSSIAMQLEASHGASILRYLEKGVLDGLRVSFRTASVSWLETFVENGGSELMVQIMRHIYPERNNGPQVAAMIEAVKTFSNCPFGIDCFVSREGLLDTLVLFLDSSDHRIKQCILHILTAIAYMNAADGPARILGAFSALQRETGEEGRFDGLLRVLTKQCRQTRKGDQAKREQGIKFVSDCLIFLNVLLEDVADFNVRVALRAELLRQPFRREFDRLDEIGLEHQRSMILAAAQADQAMFNEMVETSGVLEVIPREGCSAAVFGSLLDSLLHEARDKDDELGRRLMYLMMVPGGQLRSDHVRLLRKVLEAVLFSSSGLLPDFASAPIPLVPFDDFVSCLAPLDQRNRTREATDNLRKALEAARREKETLEANLDEQINGIRSTYENQLVKLKLQLEDSRKETQDRVDEIARMQSRINEMQDRHLMDQEALVRTKLESLAAKGLGDDEVPSDSIKPGWDERSKPRHLTPPPLPPTLASAPAPPPPPFPAFLKKEVDACPGPPTAPPLPGFLKSGIQHSAVLASESGQEDTSVHGTPALFSKIVPPSMPGAPPPPPMPAFLQKGRAPAPPPMAASPAVDLGVFPALPKPSKRLKPLAIDKLSKHEAQGTFWTSIDAKTISSGLFDLSRLDDLLDASRLDNRASVSSGDSGASQPQPQVALLDPTQSKNLSITLRGVKMSDDEIIDGIKKLSPEVPTALVSMLCDLGSRLPDDKIHALASALKTNAALKLDRPELLFIQLAKVEAWRETLVLMRTSTKIQDALTQIQEQIKPIHTACSALADAKDLFSTLGCILYLANYANQGTHRGNSHGFRVSSLKTIASMRTTSKDCSVMDFLVAGLGVRQPAWLEFTQKAAAIEAARKASPAELDRVLEGLGAMRKDLEALRMHEPGAKFLGLLDTHTSRLDDHMSTAKSEVSAAVSALTVSFALFSETYDHNSHDPVLTALLEFYREVDATRKSLCEREAAAEQRARRLAQAKPRNRSLISQEHKFGCVDNIMDRLRGEITAAAGRPKPKSSD